MPSYTNRTLLLILGVLGGNVMGFYEYNIADVYSGSVANHCGLYFYTNANGIYHYELLIDLEASGMWGRHRNNRAWVKLL